MLDRDWNWEARQEKIEVAKMKKKQIPKIAKEIFKLFKKVQDLLNTSLFYCERGCKIGASCDNCIFYRRKGKYKYYCALGFHILEPESRIISCDDEEIDCRLFLCKVFLHEMYKLLSYGDFIVTLDPREVACTIIEEIIKTKRKM